MNLELIGALSELEKERGISKDILVEAIETAIVSAYKRNFSSKSSSNVRVDLDDQTGEIHVYSRKQIVEEVKDKKNELSLDDAREIDSDYQIGDIVEEKVTPKDFGRIAAQTAKQVVIQRIREAERSMIFNEYANRAGDVVNGIIQRVEHRNVLINLGKVEAVLPLSEQIPGEKYVSNGRMRFYINEVKQSTRGPQVFVSRTHPGLLKYLFEVEVPEIKSGTVEIKSLSREAGYRSKIAVFSREENVDPVGACVGNKGMRVQAVVSQLNGEKIDIIQWVADDTKLISNALSPANVSRVVLDPSTKTARTVVPDDQLSLAIGKEGQNARLAARLTGWKIDIKSETQAQDLPEFRVETTSKNSQIDTEKQENEPINESAPTDKPIQSHKPKKTISQDQQEDMETLLAKISNVKKRKSWEERFGSEVQKEDESNKSINEKQPKSKKKKEKVLKDFSMLELDDFQFEDKK